MLEFKIPGQQYFRVAYDSSQDGGGMAFGQEYVEIVSSRYQPPFRHCLEWCSGPGFIGFALLAHGLIDRLTLMDRHEQCDAAVQRTCDLNHCGDRVSFHHGDVVNSLPTASQFDLVVANPPHYLICPGDENYQRLAVDTAWQAHRNFYQHIAQFLTRDAVVLLQENQAGSLAGPVEFFDMMQSGDLQPTAYWTSPRHFRRDGPMQIYYLESRLKQFLQTA